MERAGSKRKVGLPFLGLCQWPRSFNIRSSPQGHLCATAHFRKEILQSLISPALIPSHTFLSPLKGLYDTCLHHFGFPFIPEASWQSAAMFLASETFDFPSSPYKRALFFDEGCPLILHSYPFSLPFGELFSCSIGQFSSGLTLLFKHVHNMYSQLHMRWLWFSQGRFFTKSGSSNGLFEQTQKHKILMYVMGNTPSLLSYFCISKKEELQI